MQVLGSRRAEEDQRISQTERILKGGSILGYPSSGYTGLISDTTF